MRTWKIEMLIVALALAATNALVSHSWIELIGMAAVVASFGHVQVASRLHEQAIDVLQTEGEASFVDCSYMLNRYLVAKEILWVVYFAMHSSWSAIVGCVFFVLYPAWRRVHRGELGL